MCFDFLKSNFVNLNFMCVCIQGRMVTEKFLGLPKISMATVFTTMGAGILIVLQLVSWWNTTWISAITIRLIGVLFATLKYVTFFNELVSSILQLEKWQILPSRSSKKSIKFLIKLNLLDKMIDELIHYVEGKVEVYD